MKLSIWGFLAVFLWASPSFAQSSPGLIFGEVPTAAQWNSFFIAKQDVLGFTPLNKAGDLMLGPLSTIASTNGSSGFHITPGIAPGFPNVGDMWTTATAIFVELGGITQQLLTSSALAANPFNIAAPASTDNSTYAVNSAWVKQFFPGLTTNVESTNLPGLDMAGCTTISNCGWLVLATPTAYPAANSDTFRIQRVSPTSGGNIADVYTALNVIGTSGLNDPGNLWTGAFVLHNRTLASEGAGNLALNATSFIELNGQAPGTQMGTTWGGNLNCTDTTAVVNPTTACAGAEIDVNAAVGAGTDSHKERVGVQIAAGVYNGTDTGVHIGDALLISAQGGAVIDNAIELNDTTPTNHFTMKGTGDSLFTCTEGNWSGGNYSPCVVVTTTGGTNPAFGLFDATNANGWAFRVNYTNGDFEWDTMPALSNSSSSPTVAASLSRAGALTAASDISTPTHLLNTSGVPTLSSCGSTLNGTVATGSTNASGNITFGTITPTACTITFATAYPNYAFCTISAASAVAIAATTLPYISAQSKSAFTITIAAGAAPSFNYNCVGQ